MIQANSLVSRGETKSPFRKLENRSPTIAVKATKVPMGQFNPINGANTDVKPSDTKTPRRVFDDPKSGRPSRNVTPPAIGTAKSLLENSCRNDRHPVGDG